MWKDNRPPDWGNPYPDLTEEALTEKYLLRAMEEQKSNYELFEAGAGAILKALKEQGKYTEVAPTLSINVHHWIKGWLVFIPDEEVV